MTKPPSKKAAQTEQGIQKALVERAAGVHKTPYQAASSLGLSRATLGRRIKGGKSRREARESQQTLSKGEEDALEDWITQLTVTGHPVKRAFICAMANTLKGKRVDDPKGITIPLSWVTQFMKRHPRLKTIMARSIEAARIKDVTVTVVKE
jgi:Tc5 transposase DNA-binding domain